MHLTGLNDPIAYADRLTGDPREWQTLVEGAVVVESWFFRGGELFAFLAKRLAARATPSRVLCIPCCTGEEPYSLAMALREESVSTTKCSILGVDLSSRELAAARHGRYSEFSFRQIPAALKARYFKADEGAWRIDESLRSAVSFRPGNLIDANFLESEALFDLIFCRNLMIYLTPVARVRALDNLERLLSPDGLLCMGAAESLNDPRFEQVEPHEHFLYRRRAGWVEALRDPPRVEQVGSAKPPPTLQEPARAAVKPVGSAKPSPTIQDIQHARRLADRGETAAALEICRSLEGTPGVNAEVYHLMGVLHLAQGRQDDAGNCFRKALYLDPNHRDALIHMMHYHREHNDEKQAELYRQRWERLGAGGER